MWRSFSPCTVSFIGPLPGGSYFSLILDRPVIDLCWKIAHGVLFTADRLIGFGYSIDPGCFCGLASECLPHLFSSCPLAQSALSWLQSLMFRFSSLSPSLVCRLVLFGFSPMLNIRCNLQRPSHNRRYYEELHRIDGRNIQAKIHAAQTFIPPQEPHE